MKKLFIISVIFNLMSLYAVAQTPGYHCIYGNKDGSTIDVYIDSYFGLDFWVATPCTADPVGFIYNPLLIGNDYVATHYGGTVFPPLDTWDIVFSEPDTLAQPGYAIRYLLGGCNFWPPDCIPLITCDDTLYAGYFFMRLSDDSSLIGQTVCPFAEGYTPANGTTLWGLVDQVTAVIPSLIFSCLYFVDYLAGDANSSGNVDGTDVTFLVNYCKGFGAPPDPFLGGDANGDCIVNGMDVVYIVSYFKGGPEPFLGNCH